PELNAAEYDTLSAREDQAIIRSERLPRLTLDGSAGYAYRERTTDGLLRSGDPLFQRQLSLSLRQLLYDGGTIKNQTKASRNALLAQQYLEKAMIEDRVVDLAEVYLEIIRTRRQVGLAESNVRNHQRMRDLLRERAEAGGSRADVALVQGRLGLAVSQLATQKLSYQTAEARWERLVGSKPGSLNHPQVPAVAHSLSAVDLSNNFNYLAAAEALEGAEHRAKAMKGLYGPKIYFDGGATAGRDSIGIRGEDNEVSALVTGTWDLFRGGYNRAMNEREHFQVGKYEELKRAADLQRQYELDLIWQERAGSQASITALRKYADELSQVTGDYEDQFKVGRQELMNILDVQNESFTARSRLLDAEFDYNTAAYRLLGVQGKATLHILGPDGCEKCFSKNPKEPVLVSTGTKENAEPDNRAP
ncbi:MAG: TolC family protein, partial [Planctomycetota bacterium]